MNNEGASAIHWAVVGGHTSIVKMLILEKGVQINLQGKGTQRTTLQTPLHYAVLNSRVEIASFLLSRLDCDPSIVDALSRTPLHDAVRMKFSPAAEKVLQLLLSHWKMDANQRHGFYTPFQEACFYGELWSLKILMSVPGIQWGQEEEGKNWQLPICVE